jgi:hypothetical protein
MVRDQMRSAVALAQPERQLAPDVLEARRDAVAAVDPHDVGRPAIPRPQPAPVHAGVLKVDDLRVVDVIAPRRQDRQDQALLARELDEVVHVAEERVVGPGRVVVDPRLVPAGIGAGTAGFGARPLLDASTPWMTVKPLALRFFRYASAWFLPYLTKSGQAVSPSRRTARLPGRRSTGRSD